MLVLVLVVVVAAAVVVLVERDAKVDLVFRNNKD